MANRTSCRYASPETACATQSSSLQCVLQKRALIPLLVVTFLAVVISLLLAVVGIVHTNMVIGIPGFSQISNGSIFALTTRNIDLFMQTKRTRPNRSRRLKIAPKSAAEIVPLCPSKVEESFDINRVPQHITEVQCLTDRPSRWSSIRCVPLKYRITILLDSDENDDVRSETKEVVVACLPVLHNSVRSSDFLIPVKTALP
ncbi:hypothetical protein QR680_015784 [Steinernema hermaphroditum]|uniref:Uncharacterized protein n=1 Tax=Steinernema hermaphroditum TaxID=289476 RepID=A0AA39HA03_9BILA|nr:hypothetical protein QR680_015784 [Steinernema hermaphroditum]